jgi:hypothetical protein
MTPLLVLQGFTLLLAAHLLGDFACQTGWMVANKRNPAVLALHGSIHLVLLMLALGGQLKIALTLAAIHIAIDAVKVYALPDTLAVYLGDQTAHLLTLAGAALLFPIAEASWLTPFPATFPAAAIVIGFITATLAGGPAIGLLMSRYKSAMLAEGLPEAGRMIGLLERGLIYLMVMIGEPTGIGFLIAAKSILRFDTVSQDRHISEYVIIGTLASFGWALAASFAAEALINSLAAA